MPIYEYQCQSCEVVIEKIQKFSDEPLVDCPECKQKRLKKLVSAPVFRLKGKGWYETDFKSSDKKKNLHDESPSKPSGTEPSKSAETTKTADSKAIKPDNSSPSH